MQRGRRLLVAWAVSPGEVDPPVRARARVPVQWSVGALLDYYAGVEQRAPGWVRRAQCEWLFRFMMDPAGRWRRYLLGNAAFIGWLAGALLAGGRSNVRWPE